MEFVTFDSVNRVWKGPEINSIFNPNASLGEIILSVLAKTPNHITQISYDTGQKITCSEMRINSICVAENLKKLGYKIGDRFAILSRNNADVAPIVYGCFILGTPIHCLEPNFKSDDLASMFKLSKPKLVFCEEFNQDFVIKALEICELHDTKIMLFGESSKAENIKKILFTKSSNTNFDNYLPQLIPNPDQHPAAILCSSGTTGPSKAVCISHSQLIGQITSHWEAHYDDSYLLFTTIYWVSSLVKLIHATASGMTNIITTEPFDPDRLCKIVELYKVTTVMAPPMYVAKLLEKLENCTKQNLPDLSSIRLFITGGAFVSNDLRIRLQKFLKPNYGQVVIGLGMTEIAGLAIMSYPINKMGAAGLLRPMFQAKIVDDDGNRLGYNEHGEICYNYPYKFLGYLSNDKANKDIFDEEGWIRSGDIGYFDVDNQFHIIDRKKDIFKHMGHHISPSEIEVFLQQKLGIMEFCVVGIEDLEDYPAALIIKPNGFEMSENNIIKIVEENLPAYKHLKGGCYFIEKLPLTPSGKIQRRIAKLLAKELYEKRQKIEEKK
uniref:CSON000234 protein n=1 Tax=Culicoides sonorensis TaxID=179676 RepID=A0A336MF40_CULSO